MFYSILILATAALTSAQNGSSSGYYSTSGPLQIDPNSVDPALRTAWCRGQQNNCPLICAGPGAGLGDAYPNSCDDTTLDWTCTCTNGNMPNISAYADTIPSYVCERWIQYCVADHPNDLDGITACQSVQCGMRNASAGASKNSGGSSASASGSSPSSTASSSSGGSGGSSSGGDSSQSGSASASSSGASASQTDSGAVAMGMNYGTGLLMGGMFALFGLAL